MNINAPNELDISIAGIPVRIVLSEVDAPQRARIADRYAAFTVFGQRPDISIRLKTEAGEPFIPLRQDLGQMRDDNRYQSELSEPTIPDPKDLLQIRTFNRNNRIEFQSYFEEGWLEHSAGYGYLLMRPKGEPENFLRVLYAWFCLENRALLLHAAGLIRAGRGYVFFGRSGSGKTTISALSRDQTVLSDDLVILKRLEDRVRVYGVPFRGNLPEAPRANMAADLNGLFSLVKDTDHRIGHVAPSDAVARLAACIPFVMTDPAAAARVMDICASIEDRVPVRALHFRPDADFWRVIDASQ
jgi:hypothetical protein